jgi:hypothetical protein
MIKEKFVARGMLKKTIERILTDLVKEFWNWLSWWKSLETYWAVKILKLTQLTKVLKLAELMKVLKLTQLMKECCNLLSCKSFETDSADERVLKLDELWKFWNWLSRWKNLETDSADERVLKVAELMKVLKLTQPMKECWNLLSCESFETDSADESVLKMAELWKFWNWLSRWKKLETYWAVKVLKLTQLMKECWNLLGCESFETDSADVSVLKLAELMKEFTNQH